MKCERAITRVLIVKNPVLKAANCLKKRKNFIHRLYGTSSKPAPSSLNSKSNLLSLLKHTSDTVIPFFWKSVALSSSLLNHMISSVKKSDHISENVSLKSELNKHKISKSKDKHKKSKPTDVDYTMKSDVNTSTVKKKVEESSHLEQAFFDWMAGSDTKEKRKDFLEKKDIPASKVKKTLISKTSLQQRSRFLVCSLNEALSPGSQLLRLEEVCKHLLLYPHQKAEMCKAGLLKSSLRLNYYSNDEAVQAQALNVLMLIGYPEPPKGQGIRILSIDGGGTRAIMAIEVLRQLEAKTNKKVHELFDFMCGVSSGAILCALLGGLHYTLDECESLYREISNEVFSQSTLWGTSQLMWRHAYYDTTIWVNVLKKAFGEKLLIETSKCKNSPKIAVVSAIMNLPRLQPFLFRNYDFSPHVQSHYLGSCQYRMWEAIRASGAAPGYFEEYSLDEYLHQDGGIMVNNPTALGIHEARLLWPSEPIQCVLSLGTGRYLPSNQPTFTSTSLKTKVLKVIDSATDTEGVHVALNDLLSPYTYFRINPYLTEFFSLDEYREEKIDQMKSDAQMYIRRNEYKIFTCAMTLCIQRSYYKAIKDWLCIQKDLLL